MIVVDTNVLVAACIAGHEHHSAASAWLRRLVGGDADWALPTPAFAEFTRVLTHPRVYNLDPTVAADALARLLTLPRAQVLAPGPRFAATYLGLVQGRLAVGNRAFDAQIAAMCMDGDHVLLTGDSGFRRFVALRTLPLL